MARIRASIRYALDSKPEIGEVMEVAPGLLWLRLPLPISLDHINVWLIREEDGWALVDTGIFSETSREVWRSVFERFLDGLPLTRVLVTHLHPDHVGCAGWLSERFGVELWMARDEYGLCRRLITETGPSVPERNIRFYASAGYEPADLERYRQRFGFFARLVSTLPPTFQTLENAQNLQIGGRDWEILVGRGHSPEHACLWCRELGVLISGDQILPTISPNVSVYPTNTLANPLKHWFESLRRLQAILPEDVLVLPAHGRPFFGAHERLGELVDEHERGLEALRRLCRERRRAVDVFPALFKSRITGENLIMATGEAIAHLRYLVEDGEAFAEADAAGVIWYCMGQ